MSKLILLLFIMTGCAVTKAPYERELQIAINAENWVMCKMAYKQAHKVMISRHDHRRGPHLDHEIRDDLRDNSCRLAVGRRYWITQ